MRIRKVIGWSLVALPTVLIFIAMAADKGIGFTLLVAAGILVTGSVVCSGMYLVLKDDERKSNGG